MTPTLVAVGLDASQFAFWAAVLFMLVYTLMGSWWKSAIGWARISLDFGIALALSPIMLHVLTGIRIESSVFFAWYQITAVVFVGCVSLVNMALVIREQLKGRRSKRHD